MDQIEREVGGGVAQMRCVVGRDAADVHGGFSAWLRARRHWAHLAVGGVVEPQLRPASGQRRERREKPRPHGSTLSLATMRPAQRAEKEVGGATAIECASRDSN